MLSYLLPFLSYSDKLMEYNSNNQNIHPSFARQIVWKQYHSNQRLYLLVKRNENVAFMHQDLRLIQHLEKTICDE